MPFPFVLPTTSSTPLTTILSSSTHPSLPLNASTHRGVLRAALKKHKRLAPAVQSAHLASVVVAVEEYLPYLLALNQGLVGKTAAGASGGDMVSVTCPSSAARMEWRPTLSTGLVSGREPPRCAVTSLHHETCFVLATLAHAYTRLARSSLQPLSDVTVAVLSEQDRLSAITTATKHLLNAASVYNYAAVAAATLGPPLPPSSPSPTSPSAPASQPPCPDITLSAFHALSSLALAEATLLAVLKDDPYPAVVAQDRNKLDREWMFKAPSIPKVRAHLFARLCLAAADHAARSSSLLQPLTTPSKGLKISDALMSYVEDLRRTCRAKACRFFAIDAELGGQTGTAIAWLNGGMHELGIEGKKTGDSGSGVLGLGRLKREWSERREDRKVEKGTMWGMDAGKLEEARVLEMLEAKWVKMNDAMNTQIIPPFESLIAQIPSGRDIHSVQVYRPPTIDGNILESFKASPGQAEVGQDDSSDEDGDEVSRMTAPGSFPADESSSDRVYY